MSVQKDEEMINNLSKQFFRLGGKPNLENDDNKSLIIELSKQLEEKYGAGTVNLESGEFIKA